MFGISELPEHPLNLNFVVQKFMLFGCIWRTEMRAMKGEGKKFLRNLSPAVEDKYSLKANIHCCRDTLISQDTHF